MNYSDYCKTHTRRADVLAAEGALPVGCKVIKSGIAPALSPEKVSETQFGEAGLFIYSALGGKFIVCAGGTLHTSADGIKYDAVCGFASAFPFAFEERVDGVWKTCVAGDASCLSCGADGTDIKDTALGLSCGVPHCGRLFGADASDGYKLRWSGEGGAFDWTESISGAGWLALDPEYGEILKLLKLGSRLVAVRKRGFTLFEMHGNPENFSVTSVRCPSLEISGSSSAVAGGNIIFYCADGLYRFDGVSAEKTAYGFESRITAVSGAVSASGNYYACAKLNSGKRAVLVICRDGSAFIADCAAKALACRGDEIFALCDDGIYALKKGGEYAFTSGSLDFGTARKKALSGIFIDGFAREAEIFCDGQTRIYQSVKGLLPVHMCGASFKITLKSPQKINAVYAYAEVPNDV